MRVWPILRRVRITSSRLDDLVEVDHGIGDFLIEWSLLEVCEDQNFSQVLWMRER